MKKFIAFSFLLLLVGGSLFAKTQKHGYTIEINFQQDIADEYVHLAHYFAKPLPTIYKTDSAKVINKRKAVFQKNDSILGGIYLVLFENRGKYFEMILDNGQTFSLTVDTTNLPLNITYKNHPENIRYTEYQKFLDDFGKKQGALMERLASAKTAKDSAVIREEGTKLFKEVTLYRKNYAQKNKGTFLANVFNALLTPEVPEGKHYLPNTQVEDTFFVVNYYKKHYWDLVDFKDNRLVYTPLYEGKLNEYFSRLVYPVPDSVIYEADLLLKKTRGASEFFKYTLHWLARYAESSKVMGMDEVFVHLVENYYMKGDAFWLDSASLSKYEDRARKIAPNVLGNVAAELPLKDIWTLEDVSPHDIKADYTIIFFWSIECSHCKKELVSMDSVYRNTLQKKGVKMFGVPTVGNLTDIQNFVKEKGLDTWTHAVNTDEKSKFRENYDVYSTPKIYVLDADKKFIGKNIDHSNVAEVIEFYEKKNKK